MHEEVRNHRHSSWLQRKSFASAFPCLPCQDIPGRNSAGFTSETASQAQITAHKAAWGSKMTTNILSSSLWWLRSFLLNKGVWKCCRQHYQHFTQLLHSLSSSSHTAVIFPLILTAVRSPSQTQSTKLPSEYTYLLLQQRKTFSSGFPSQVVRLLPGRRKTEATFGEKSALRFAPTWKTCLVALSGCSASLQVHLGHVYKGGTDQTSACTPPHPLGCLQSPYFSSLEPEQMSLDSTTSAAGQCNCLLSSHFFM